MIDFLKKNLKYFRDSRSVELAQDSLIYFWNNLIPISTILIPFALPSIFLSVNPFLVFDLSGNSFLAKFFPIILEHILSPISIGALITLFSKTIKCTFSTQNSSFLSFFLYYFQDFNYLHQVLTSSRFYKGIRVNL